jgi:hypothetical protein
VGEDVLDLVTWDRAGVVVYLVDEPCEVPQRATNNQKGREVDDVIARNLGPSILLTVLGPCRGEAAFLKVVREVVRGNTQECVEAGDRVFLSGRETGGVRARSRTCGASRWTRGVRGARGGDQRNTTNATVAFPGGRSRGLRGWRDVEGREPRLQRTETSHDSPLDFGQIERDVRR